MASINYTADDVTNFMNPERGFTYAIATNGSEVGTASFFSTQAATYSRSFYRVTYDIGNYKSGTAIDATKLAEIDTTMNRLRSAGVKCAFRVWYEATGNGADAAHSVVMSHLAQIKPYISAHEDVIAVFEAGFVGSWGEWAFSNNYGNTDGSTYTAGLTTTQWSNREAVVLAMLSAAPADMFVSVRCPYFKMHFFGNNAMTAGEAYAQTNKARVGHFNDAYISSNNDFNTYISTATDRAYLAAETNWLPFGGESAAFNSTYAACTPAQAENARMHASYLNQFYFGAVIDNWSASGCFSTIQINLGHRFQLISSTYATTATIGSSLSVNIHCRNNGYAAPFGRRSTYYVLRNGSQSHAYVLAADCRNWQSGSFSIAETVSLSAMPAGTYNAYLWMPDRHPTLSNRPAYSIRFANNNVWNATEGFNDLGQTIEVVSAAAAASDPGTPFLHRKLRRIFG